MRFSRTTPFVLALTLAAGLAPGVHAQSLADVARQEAERRKAIKTEAKVYTNKDLRPAPSAGTVAPDAGAPSMPPEAPQASPTDAAAADGPDRSRANDTRSDGSGENPVQSGEGDAGGAEAKHDATYWSGRRDALQTALERDQTHLEALQSRVNALATDFVNRDDPAQRAVIAAERQKALAEIERMKKQIDDDRAAIVGFEEEARRAAVPPGWLR